MKKLESNRLILRNIEIEDADDLFLMDSDPEVHHYLGNHPVKTLKESKDMIDSIQTQYRLHGIGRWALVIKSSGEFAGWYGLKLEERPWKSGKYYDLGYRLKRKFWGQGIASEAARCTLTYGLEEMNLKEICAAAHIENIASNKIIDKLGFQFIKNFDFDGSTHNWYELKNPNLS